jgi:hypothetical protein
MERVRLLLPHCAPLLTISTHFVSTRIFATYSKVIHNFAWHREILGNSPVFAGYGIESVGLQRLGNPGYHHCGLVTILPQWIVVEKSHKIAPGILDAHLLQLTKAHYCLSVHEFNSRQNYRGASKICSDQFSPNTRHAPLSIRLCGR